MKKILREEKAEKQKKSRKSSLNKKLKRLLWFCILPLSLLIVVFLGMTIEFSYRYDRIVSNITIASEHSLEFKENLDYTMYIIVVNSERAQELIEEDPHTQIQAVRSEFARLQTREKDENAGKVLQQIIKSVDSLEEQVYQLEENAAKIGMYESNLDSLDLDIRVLTEIIQDEIQQYISLEADYLETLRLGIRQEVKRAVFASIVLFGVILILALRISHHLLDALTRDLRNLCLMTRRAGNGDFSVRANVENCDEELEELGEGFNQMVERLDTLVKDIRIEQQNLRRTEQKLLQAQINPHFLYNTLDAIIWLAEAGEKEQVITMVTALSDFFRTTLSKGKDFITVAEEESHIRSYLQIQQFRYQDILEYEIRIPEELYAYPILKLTLQPLVENALYHGIKNKRGKGQIRVIGFAEKEKMRFVVTDNGIGMTQERLRQVRHDMNQDVRDNQEPEGFGLYNVAQRIRLNYGPYFDLQIDSVYGEGTQVTVELPLQETDYKKLPVF